MPLLVVATPPTPNGDLHLGHLSGPYLAADILARAATQRGDLAALVTGLDDHQTYTELRALRDGSAPEAVADHFGQAIEASWRAAAVRPDHVTYPRQDRHHAARAAQAVATLHRLGQLDLRERPLPWCRACQRWCYEGFVTGICPHCAAPSGGNVCEVCGHPNDCADLAQPTCALCGRACDLRLCARWYLPLEAHRDQLRDFWDRTVMDDHVRRLCEQLAEQRLPDVAVSHPGHWGLPLDLAGAAGQRIFTWLEMASGYIAATDTLTARQRFDWSAQWRGGQVAECFGFDNAFYYAFLFPVVLRALEPDAAPATTFVGNELYQLAGEKFSTSRQHAIWTPDAVRRRPTDHLRLFLAYDRPATGHTSFTWPALAARLDDDLLSLWHGWLAEAARRRDLIQAAAPPGAADALAQGRAWSEPARHLTAESFSPRTALGALRALAARARAHAAAAESEAGSAAGRARLARAVAEESSALAWLAIGLWPIAPTLAEQLWHALGLHGLPSAASGPPAADVTAEAPGRCALLRPTLAGAAQ
ncbi:methionyl-tRNA synthetase [Parafrankia irregularis]|uniref:Methionyl-tRNA synthetase n=1 Tax=Parafrankia irregularis TaxID=795642 RepID=A0A0S4QYR7_9ACTN|nr:MULTISPECIES: class I tRNA ligase family protein [Parafrankia]MBE3205812.1 class I tRNA ligase family protein [Parafrankia sp. CH37]CUU59686.1 methionyl-tRNA synthetase [Parafrankia irregularis]